jgi:hypothetical protein
MPVISQNELHYRIFQVQYALIEISWSILKG